MKIFNKFQDEAGGVEEVAVRPENFSPIIGRHDIGMGLSCAQQPDQRYLAIGVESKRNPDSAGALPGITRHAVEMP